MNQPLSLLLRHHRLQIFMSADAILKLDEPERSLLAEFRVSDGRMAFVTISHLANLFRSRRKG